MSIRSALSVAALSACVACDATPRTGIGAPPDSYAHAPMTVVVDGPTESVYGARVKPEFFTTGGMKPVLGRFFVEPEYTGDGQDTVAVLSQAYWTQRLRSDPGVIGRVIAVDGQRRVIVGVAPAEFEPERSGSLWIPVAR